MITRLLTAFVTLVACDQMLAQEHEPSVALYELPDFKLKWHTDFEKALEESKEENRPLLIFFTGSDWCHSCQELQKNVLTQEPFQDVIREKFICVNIDFPLHHRLSIQEISQNQELKKRFNIEGFPTAVILLPSGETLMFAGHFPSKAEECGKMFVNELDKANKLENVLSHFDKESLSEEDLENLYNEARIMGRKNAMMTILEAGFAKNSETNPFFLKEKYRSLVNQGFLDEEEAKSIKEKLIALDPQNEKGHHLYISVTEFEALVKAPENKRSTQAATPLIHYLEQFGNEDHQNCWRVELMLANFLRGAGEPKKAVKFAKAAFVKAPDLLKEEIQASIDEMEALN